jgi:Tol biopolymer transport system component
VVVAWIEASVEGAGRRRLFGTDDLLAALPQTDRPPQLFIRYVVPRPGNPDLLFALLADRMGREAYVFSFNRQSGEITLRLQTKAYDEGHSLGFSPDGRWLVATGFDVDTLGSEPSSSGSLHLHDIDQNRTETFVVNTPSAFAWGTYDWSADGQWLATIVGDRVVNLTAPAHDYQTIIPRDFGVCSTIAWINR